MYAVIYLNVCSFMYIGRHNSCGSEVMYSVGIILRYWTVLSGHISHPRPPPPSGVMQFCSFLFPGFLLA